MRLRHFLLLLLPLLLIGCASVSTTPNAGLSPLHGDFEIAAGYAQHLRDMPANERAAAGRNIERLLAGVNNDELASQSARLSATDPLYPFAARELSKRGLRLPHAFDRGAMAQTQNFPPADPDGYRPPSQLAVLLPITGSLAVPAASVRDGIFAAYYNETRRRPAIKVYDTGGTADGVQRAATQAMADGAQMILGPLGRDEASVIFNQANIDIPVIALNRGAVAPTPGNASFALSPEEEGLVAADHLADRGVMKVFAISQHDESAQRILGAFREQLRARGGEIVGEMSINDGTADIATSFQQALAGAKSPPNSVFLVLRASQARLAAAQIRVSPLAASPRVSSSLILSGGSNTKLDTELDGIELPVLPWLVDQRPSLPRPEELAKTLPSARGAAQPLFAFGMDAWQLAVYFDRLNNDPGFAISGATGELRLGNSGIVQREPAWAIFSGGRPHAVAPSH